MIEDCEKKCEYWHDASAGVYAWEWCSFPDGKFVSYIHNLKYCPRWKERIAALEARQKALVEAALKARNDITDITSDSDLMSKTKMISQLRDTRDELKAVLDAAEGEE